MGPSPQMAAFPPVLAAAVPTPHSDEPPCPPLGSRQPRPGETARTWDSSNYRAPSVPAVPPLSRRLRGAALRLDALLAEQTTQALALARQPEESLGHGGKTQLRAGPPLPTAGLPPPPPPSPVAHPRRALLASWP